jgi:hypothetical protein
MKISFLPAFFVGLAVVFAAAVGLRLHSYSARSGDPAQHAVTESSASSDAGAPARARSAAAVASATIDGEVPTASRAAEPVSSRIVDAPRGGAQQPRLTREQRFAEALAAAQKAGAERPQQAAPRQAPAPVVPPKPAEKPGLLARIGNAISNAFSGSSNAAPSRVTSSLQNGPQQNSRANDPSNNNNANRDKPAAKDNTSDTQPPQLLGIEFNPPQINDGAETMILITATDDLSGIRNISGSVSSPTGKALQGFAAQREAPESNRYTARIAVPKDAEQGMWRVNFLSLTDNAGNTNNVAQGWNGVGATFRVVSSHPDSTPPSLRSVYLEKRSMNGGEKNTVFVQATDDSSGVAIVSGVFQSPKKTARIGFGCRMTSPETFECDLVPPKTVDCGDWSLEQIQLQDKAQNMATIRTDNPIVAQVKVNIIGDRCDSTPPDVQSLALDPLDVSNAEASVVNVTVVAHDDDSGVASLSGQAAGPVVEGGQPPRIYFAFQPGGQDPSTWIAHITVPKLAAKGTWSIVWLQALDKSNNLKTYSQGDPVLANAKFTVH